MSQRAFTSLHVRQVYDDRQPRYEPPRSNRQVRIVWQLRCASEKPVLDCAEAVDAETVIETAIDTDMARADSTVMLNPERMTT